MNNVRNPEEIETGDVVLDLAQGRPMQVVGEYDGNGEYEPNAAGWSEDENYNLLENYGNSRLGATEEDAVFTCVYVGSVRSEPSKDYDFPVSRLARIEVEKADAMLKRPAEEIRQQLIASFAAEVSLSREDGSEEVTIKELMIRAAGNEDLVEEAFEVGGIEAEERKSGQQTELGDN